MRIVLALLAFLLIWLPQTVQGLWGLFTGEPIIPVVASYFRRKGIKLPQISPNWMTAPMGIGLLIVITWREFKNHANYSAASVTTPLTVQSDPRPTIEDTPFADRAAIKVSGGAVIHLNVGKIQTDSTAMEVSGNGRLDGTFGEIDQNQDSASTQGSGVSTIKPPLLGSDPVGTRDVMLNNATVNPKQSLVHDPQSITITTTNQSGGFTGVNNGTINQGEPARILSDLQRAAIISALNKLPEKPKVTIFYMLSDSNAGRYEKQFEDLFKSAGVTYDTMWFDGSPTFPMGLTVLSPEQKYDIEAIMITSAVHSGNIPCEVRRGSLVGGVGIQFLVGPASDQ